MICVAGGHGLEANAAKIIVTQLPDELRPQFRHGSLIGHHHVLRVPRHGA
jgi:hypothetical protein